MSERFDSESYLLGLSKITDAVTDWLDENVEPVGSAVVVDSSLSISGAAADAKETGDLFDTTLQVKSISGITNANDFWRGIYQISTNALSGILNLPPTSRGIIVLSYDTHSNNSIQVAYDFNHDSVFNLSWMRKKSNGVWSSWVIQNNDPYVIPTKITSGDANNFEAGTCYYTTPSNSVVIQNVPFKRVAGVIKTRGMFDRNAKIQTFQSWANDYNGVYAIRSTTNGSNWTDWRIVSDSTPLDKFGFTVITDSLGSGYIMNDAGETGKDYYEFSWPAYLGRKLGCRYYISGAGGKSTVDWLASDTYGLLGMFARIPATPIYVITLGTNDANQSVTEQTFKTNYASIITAIKSKQPNALIFCMRLWRTSAPWSTYDGYLVDILQNYSSSDNVFELNINSAVNASPISLHLWQGHYDAVGYKLIADEIEKAFMTVANANPSKFRQTFNDMMTNNPNNDKGFPYAF